MKKEFKKGDVVHWQIFKEQKPIEAKVLDVFDYIWDGGKVEYRLEGIDQPLITRTTGKSILESEYFMPPVSKKDWFKS